MMYEVLSFIGAIGPWVIAAACLSVLINIERRLAHIAELLVWQVESDDGDPPEPDEGEPMPVAQENVVRLRRIG